MQHRPDDANAYNNLGLALEKLGKTDEAIVQWKTAIRLDDNLAQAYINLGKALKDKGETKREIGVKPDS